MISVIMPSYNSEQTIEKCLDALQKQTYRGDYEIILVDSSIDKTPLIVRNSFPRVRFFHLEKKTDPGTARNIGIKEAKGDIIAFIDSDCRARNDWLIKISESHADSNDVVGGAINCANEPEDLIGWAGYIAEFREFLPELRKEKVKHIPTCNISYKKAIFDKFGVFDGKYYPQEDLVYNLNLEQKGCSILFNPSIQVYHLHRSRMEDFLRHQKKIGMVTARVLKEFDLEGAYIVRNHLLLILLIPIIPCVKFTRTTLSFLRYQPLTVLKRPLVLLVFLIGLVYWSVGFAGAGNEKRK